MSQQKRTSLSIYQVGGSLPLDASTYVRRESDEELYQLLKEGKFCYILNSRQMGKSSLRVQTMARLQGEGIACAAIDLTEIGSSDITRDEWYAGIIDSLSDSFTLEGQFDLEEWWTRLGLLSPSQKLGKFFGDVLLKQVKEPIVIFIDEIDSTLKFPFKDDFFALLRACYNLRADHQNYTRLTFCLLGVASPSDLIADKQSTPFNIGEQIYLKGFERDEVKPLTEGLEGKVDAPAQVMSEILFWTGGQPFLTQRLCNLIIRQPTSVSDLKQLIEQEVIEHWEAKDEQKHFSTIRDRLLDNEQKASYLLELYRKVLKEQEINLETPETAELQLTGLVVKKQNKLEVYNPIYREIFNQEWIDNTLNNLRPYRENFSAWIASGEQDESRLLAGQFLREAEDWAKNKSASFQDTRFLRESFNKESKDKAIKESNQILEDAARKNQKKLRIGSFILSLALMGAAICGVLAAQQGQKALKIQEDYEQILSFFAKTGHLEELATKLDKLGKKSAADEIREQIRFSEKIKDIKLKQAFLLSSKSLAYQYLEKLPKAQEVLANSEAIKKIWYRSDSSSESLLISLFLEATHAQLLLLQNPDQLEKAKPIFEKVSRIVQKKKLDLLDVDARFFPRELYRQLASSSINELEALLEQKKWREANEKTTEALLLSAYSESYSYFSWDSVSCPTLRQIDQLWVDRSNGYYGFSVQLKIYRETGNPIGEYSEQAYKQFGQAVGWNVNSEWLDYEQFWWVEPKRWVEPKIRGHLPRIFDRDYGKSHIYRYRVDKIKESHIYRYRVYVLVGGDVLVRLVNCNI